MPTLTEEKSPQLPSEEGGLPPAPGETQPPVARGSRNERFAFFALALLILYAAARNIRHSLLRPLWYDEILTMLMVQQKHVSELWQALTHGVDSHPLAFYLLERAVAPMIHNENLAYRSISIMGFGITLLCLFVAVRTRKGSAIAVVCAAVPLTTMLFNLLAVEGRGYSILVACIAFAVVCYQRAPARRWVVLLGMNLVLAESFHYFAVFAFLPFFLAEATHYALARQFRRGVWIALLSGFVPLPCFWPVLAAMQKYFGPHIWSKPTMEIALNSYSWYFLIRESSPGLYLAAAAAMAILFTMFLTVRRTSQGSRSAGAPASELVLVLGLLSLPLMGFAVVALSHSGMVAKYLAPSMLGFPLALGFSLPKLPRWGFLVPTVSAALLLCLIVPRERAFWSFYKGQFVSPAVFVEEFVNAGGHPDLPVVLSDVLDLLPLQHYADKGWRQRFVVVLDPEQALAYTGNDTPDKHLAILRQYTTLPIYDWQPFLAQHPAFLVYSNNGGMDRDWWPGRLKKWVQGPKRLRAAQRGPRLFPSRRAGHAVELDSA